MAAEDEIYHQTQCSVILDNLNLTSEHFVQFTEIEVCFFLHVCYMGIWWAHWLLLYLKLYGQRRLFVGIIVRIQVIRLTRIRCSIIETWVIWTHSLHQLFTITVQIFANRLWVLLHLLVKIVRAASIRVKDTFLNFICHILKIFNYKFRL